MTFDYVRLKYSGALDGVRAGAVLLVMAHHLGLPVRGGHIGVNVFFVLSGFLITHLLLDERITRGRIAFGNFYARRALRLYPALIAVIIAAVAYSLTLPDAYRASNTLNSVPMVLLYLGNWVRAGVTDGSPLGLFEHTWSLSVEEQFYLVWPWLIWIATLWTKKVSVVGWLATTGIAASVLLRLIAFPDISANARVSNGLDTQADQLLIGALLAVIMISVHRRDRVNRFATYLRIAFWPASATLLAAVVFWPLDEQAAAIRLATVAVAVAAAILIGYVYLSALSWQSKALSSRPMRYIGQRSYGLYLWHYPIFAVVLYAAHVSGSNRSRLW